MRIDPLLYFWFLLKASLFSTGGMGNLPSVHADTIPRGWATEHDFAESLTIGQISPGPTGTWVISFGYLTYGLRGSLLATLAVLLPPLLVLAVRRLYSRTRDIVAVEGFIHGLGLAAVGTFTCVLLQLLIHTGLNPKTGIVVLAAFVCATMRKIPTAAILGAAALFGALVR